MLRALFGLPLQIFDLAAHVTKLPFLFRVFQAVLVRKTLLCLGDETGESFVDLPGDSQLQLLLPSFNSRSLLRIESLRRRASSRSFA